MAAQAFFACERGFGNEERGGEHVREFEGVVGAEVEGGEGFLEGFDGAFGC